MALVIALTGGTGFVGGHSIQNALARGHRVRALTRRPQPQSEGVTWIQGSLNDADALQELTRGADVVLHIAGVTNAEDKAGFIEGNITGTQNMLAASGNLPFVHVSSLSAREPHLSTYGWSKRMGENLAMRHMGPVTAVRPPAVYGPGDREFLELFKTAKTGFLPMPRHSRASMIYGADLADALVALCEELTGTGRSSGQVFEIDDGVGGYTPQQVADAIGHGLGKNIRAIEVSPRVLRLAAHLDTWFAKLQGKKARLSLDRANYMAHEDWTGSNAALETLGIWQPTTSLKEGLLLTAQSYRQQGLLA